MLHICFKRKTLYYNLCLIFLINIRRLIWTCHWILCIYPIRMCLLHTFGWFSSNIGSWHWCEPKIDIYCDWKFGFLHFIYFPSYAFKTIFFKYVGLLTVVFAPKFFVRQLDCTNYNRLLAIQNKYAADNSAIKVANVSDHWPFAILWKLQNGE